MSIVNEKTTLTEYFAILYLRLSKEDKLRMSKTVRGEYESDSISNQRKLIYNYLKNYPEITVIDEAFDDGYTGTNYDRPGFHKVLDAIKEGRVNCVIVKDLSRLGREYIETGKYLEMIFPSFGVRFISINDDVDSENPKNGDDIIIPVKNIFNESYCRELSKKLRRQFKIQRSNGEFLSAFASYGYLKSPDDKHKLIIDDYSAEVVRGIFSLKVKGYSQQAIADYLNAEQILSPADYKKNLGLKYKSGFQSSQQGKWSAVTIRNILTNQVYIGTLIQGKRGTPNYKIKKMRMRKEEDWVVVEGNHDPIIDPLTFFGVQKMLERDTRKSPEQDTVFPLSGVLFCPDCKSPMCRRSVSRGNKKFFYYVCSKNKSGKGCSSHSFEQGKLEQTVLHAIAKQIDAVIELDKFVKEIGNNSLIEAKIKRLDLMITQKNKEIDDSKEFRMKLYEALNDDLISREEYDKMRSKYTARIAEAQKVTDGYETERSRLIEEGSQDNSWMQQFMKFKNLSELSREVVFTLIDKVFVYEQKHIRIEFNYRNEFEYCRQVIENSSKEVV